MMAMAIQMLTSIHNYQKQVFKAVAVATDPMAAEAPTASSQAFEAEAVVATDPVAAAAASEFTSDRSGSSNRSRGSN